jgi:hypothetical protein
MHHRTRELRAAVARRDRSQGHLRAVTATVGVGGVVTAGAVAFILPGATHATASAQSASTPRPAPAASSQPAAAATTGGSSAAASPHARRHHHHHSHAGGAAAGSAGAAAASSAPAPPSSAPAPVPSTAPSHGVSGGS